MPPAIKKFGNRRSLIAHPGYWGTEELYDAGGSEVKVGKIGSARQAVPDGDTINISLPTRPRKGDSGVDGNLSIRMLGMDTPEVGLYHPEDDEYYKLNGKWKGKWVEFLSNPIEILKTKYDIEYSTDLSIYIHNEISSGYAAENHIHYAEKATKKLKELLDDDIKEYKEYDGDTGEQLLRGGETFEFYIRFAFEYMDRYGRILGFINRNQPDEYVPSPRPFDYNTRMLFSGWALPYFIWPNINPFRVKGSILGAVFPPGKAALFADDDWKLRQARRAVRQVRAAKQGLYAEDGEAGGPLCLEPFELRFLAGKRKPDRWVIDLGEDDDILIHPENYHTIQNPEDRLFISQEHVSLFVDKGWELQDPPPGYKKYIKPGLELKEREEYSRYINKNPLRGANTHPKSKTIYAAWSDGESGWAAAAAECGTVFLINPDGKVISHDVPQASGIDFYDIFGFKSDDSVELIVVGTYGSVFRTKPKPWEDLIEGLKNEDAWERLESNTESWLEAVWGWSADNFYVAGDDGLIMRYQGKKEGWSTIVTGGINRLYSICGSSDAKDDLAYVVGSFGTILRVHKNQVQRVRIPKNILKNIPEDERHLNGIQLIPTPPDNGNSEKYVICGKGGVLLSMENGEITKIDSKTTETLMGLDAGESGKFVIVGYRGTWLRYDGASGCNQATLHKDELGSNSYMEGVVYTGNKRFLAVGWYGRIMRRDPDKESWETLQTGRAEAIHSIAIHGERIIAAGDTGTIRVIDLRDDQDDDPNIFAPPLDINIAAVIDDQIVVAGEKGYLGRVNSDSITDLKRLEPPNTIHAHTVFNGQHYFVGIEGLFLLEPNGDDFVYRPGLFIGAFDGELSSDEIVGIAIQQENVLFACDDRGNLHRIVIDGGETSREIYERDVQALFGRDGEVIWIAGNRLHVLADGGPLRILGSLDRYFPNIGEQANVGMQDGSGRIFIGGGAGTVLCFTEVDEEPLLIFSGTYRRVTALAANENYLVVGTEGGRLQIMEYVDGNLLPELKRTSSISGPTYHAVVTMEETKFAFCGQESITRIITPPDLQGEASELFRGDLLVGIPLQNFVLFAGVENAVRVNSRYGKRIQYLIPGHTITALCEYNGTVYLGTAGGKILKLGLEKFDENGGERQPTSVIENLDGIPIELSVDNGGMRIVLDTGLVYIEELSNPSLPLTPAVDLRAQLPDKLTAPSAANGTNDDFYAAGNYSYLSKVKDKELKLIEPPPEKKKIKAVTLHGCTGPDCYWYGGTTGSFWLRAKDRWYKVSTGIGNQLHGIAASSNSMVVVADYGGIRFGNKALIDEINAAVQKSEEGN